jgi:hypothetical protein
MLGFTCKAGETLSLLDALWCQIYMENTKKQPYDIDGHYTFWDWLDTSVIDPSYYTVEPFEDCNEGTKFDSWFENNSADAITCRDSLTRLNGQCYETRLIGTSWFGNRYYQIVRSRDPEPSPYCEFMLARAKVDAQLLR